jgi:hypothetical protein
MVGKRRAQRFTALSCVLLLAACGGGGGSHASVVPGAATTAAPQGTGHVTFSISVPAAAASAQAKRRAPAYVSPATKSAAISVGGVTTNIDLTSGSAGCSTDYAHGSISEIPVGLEPRGFLPQPNGMYFVEDAGGGVGLITGGNTYTDVSTGEYQEGLILGPDGDLWISHRTSPGCPQINSAWFSHPTTPCGSPRSPERRTRSSITSAATARTCPAIRSRYSIPRTCS